MGDHRFELKAEFSMHGHEKKINWNLNWSDSIPERLAEWVEQQYQEAMNFWYEAEWTAEDHRNAEIERTERAELDRLKAKYEPPH
jgi:hypothetical protein